MGYSQWFSPIGQIVELCYLYNFVTDVKLLSLIFPTDIFALAVFRYSRKSEVKVKVGCLLQNYSTKNLKILWKFHKNHSKPVKN